MTQVTNQKRYTNEMQEVRESNPRDYLPHSGDRNSLSNISYRQPQRPTRLPHTPHRFSERRSDPATGLLSSPTACGDTGFIQFRSRQKTAPAAFTIATCDEHDAMGEERRAVEAPSIIKAACDRPISRGRIVNFRARDRTAVINTTRD
jgi:hypothetical protein